MAKKPGHIVGVGSRLDAVQTACDVVGMTEIPLVSQGADIASGLISLATGDYVGAALSAGGLIPGVGQATGAMKMARRTAKVVDAASDVKKGEKFLDLTLSTRKVDVSSSKNTITKKSQIDAKQPQKTKELEKEKFSPDNVVQEPVVGGKLDIIEGNGISTNQLAGKGLDIKVEKPIQSSNYNSFVKTIEQGKPFYNPNNVMPKFGI